MTYDSLVTREQLSNVVTSLAKHNVEAIVVSNRTEALEVIKSFIPAGASVMNGSSRTLEEIGFVDYLKSGSHRWNNLHEGILAEKDPVKQSVLRKQAVLSDYYLGSVHALVVTGEFLIASNTGSQLPHIVFTSSNLIFVVGTQKIVPTLADAFKRLEDYVVPLEDQNMKTKYGIGTNLSKIVVFKHENPAMKRKVRMILVQAKLGF